MSHPKRDPAGAAFQLTAEELMNQDDSFMAKMRHLVHETICELHKSDIEQMQLWPDNANLLVRVMKNEGGQLFLVFAINSFIDKQRQRKYRKKHKELGLTKEERDTMTDALVAMIKPAIAKSIK